MVLIASIATHCPDVLVELFAPNASDALKTWLLGYPFVNLNIEQPGNGVAKYDVKPRALLKLLDRGYSEAIWLDSDILVCRNFLPFFSCMDPDVFAAAEEALCEAHADPDSLRARLWGLPVGRALPFTANSAVIRASYKHRSLLEKWESLLLEPSYRAAQACDWRDRPPHLMGDQEVLTAVLCSSEFASVPLTFLFRGSHIVQYFGTSGYTVAERLRNLFGGMPLFVHSQGFRPWWQRAKTRVSMRRAFRDLYDDLSPYTLLARRYRGRLPDSSWMEAASPIARAMTLLGFGRAELVGLPLALLFDVVRLGRRLASSGR